MKILWDFADGVHTIVYASFYSVIFYGIQKIMLSLYWGDFCSKYPRISRFSVWNFIAGHFNLHIDHTRIGRQ